MKECKLGAQVHDGSEESMMVLEQSMQCGPGSATAGISCYGREAGAVCNAAESAIISGITAKYASKNAGNKVAYFRSFAHGIRSESPALKQIGINGVVVISEKGTSVQSLEELASKYDEVADKFESRAKSAVPEPSNNR